MEPKQQLLLIFEKYGDIVIIKIVTKINKEIFIQKRLKNNEIFFRIFGEFSGY